MSPRIAVVGWLCFVAGWSGAYADPLPIVQGGQPVAAIVVADQAMPLPDSWRLKWTTHDAATFLQDYIEQVSGATLPIVKESEAADVDRMIVVGDTQLGRAAGVSPDGLPGEGYRIKSFDKGVVILGEIHEGVDRGTLLGVYDFLERVAGVKWYFPGDVGTIIPHRDTLAVAGLDVTNHPRFEVRIGGVGHWQTEVARAWHPVLRYGMRQGLSANHTHESWYDRFAESNPEYFGVREDGTRAITSARAGSGQSQAYLCFSEPGVLEQHMKDAAAWLERGDASAFRGGVQPRGNIIPFGPSDVRKVCVCEDCSKLIDRSRGRHGFSSDLIFDFVARFAERLKQQYPDAVLSVLAYDHYQLPPTHIDRLPDNVMVTVCLLPSVIQMAQPEIHAELRSRIDQWSHLVGGRRDRLIIWDYFCYPNWWFVAPTEIPHVLQEHIGYLEDKALGVFNNGFNPQNPKSHTMLYLTYRIVWLMHQLLWNPDLDVDRARYEWCHDLFGPAGDVMDEFYTLLEQRWENVPWDHQSTTAIHVGQNLLYEQTYPLEVVDELKRLLSQARHAAARDADALRRLEWFETSAFQPFFEEAAQFHAVVGRIPDHEVTQAQTAPIIDAVLEDAVWQSAPPQVLAQSLDGLPAQERTQVMIAADAEALYIAARLESADPEALKGEAGAVTVDDDKFIIHLRPTDEPSFVELIINPAGGVSTDTNPMKTFGIFPSHPIGDWDGRGVEGVSRVEGNMWTAEIRVPWSSLPGLNAAPPRLRAQFLRWASTSKYKFDSWSPTMSTWDYPASRFGHLVIDGSPTHTVELNPAAGGAAYMSAIGPETDQPTEVGTVRVDTETLIVGQRDLVGGKWIELRSVVQFDLSELKVDGASAVNRATLSLYHINAVEAEPFDDVLVDHIMLGESADMKAGFAAQSLREDVGVLLPASQVGQRRMFSVDVSECVRADLAADRSTSTFRLRIPQGPTQHDEKTHYLIFRGISQQHSNQVPRLVVEVAEPSRQQGD